MNEISGIINMSRFPNWIRNMLAHFRRRSKRRTGVVPSRTVKNITSRAVIVKTAIKAERVAQKPRPDIEAAELRRILLLKALGDDLIVARLIEFERSKN